MSNALILLERLKPMKAIHAYSLSNTPEEEAYRKILELAKQNDIPKENARLFGRNIYISNKTEPHGYEYYLTINQDINRPKKAEIKTLPGGLFAVLKGNNLSDITQSWKNLIELVESSGYTQASVSKEEYGWVTGDLEEHTNWHIENPKEWLFDLWLKIRDY
ncbi:MAG: GyrI-like domain-containing protein [Candidatus Bathyarchaeota archaeon]|nr:GyrI-like domain-containing protein [Candidatus Bathyarchaeota archaeon]